MANWKVAWCRMMHDEIAYGGGNVYWCRKCLCRFEVPWVPEIRPQRERASVRAPEVEQNSRAA